MDADGATSLAARLEQQLEAAQRLDDETASRSTRSLMPGSTSLVLSQLPREVCLAEAATRIADAYNVLHGGRYNRVLRRGGAVIVQIDDRGFPFASTDPGDIFDAMETALLFFHALLFLVAPGQAERGLIDVSLRRPHGPASVPFARLARVRYAAQFYALRYEAGAADEVVARPGRAHLTYEAAFRTQIAILRRMEGATGGPALTQQVASLLRDGADQAAVAESLSMSPVTLRRRLAELGTSFRSIRAEVLAAQAEPLLEGGLALPDVAARLGFADVRSFNRAYKSWTGRTPSAARRGRAAPASD